MNTQSSFANCQFDMGSPRAIYNSQEFLDRITNNAVPPIMCYVEPSKSTSSGETFISRERKLFQRLVAEAETMAIIGIQFRPEDTHIWEPLAQTPARIVYCSGASAVEDYQQWANKYSKRKNDLVIPKYFAQGFDEICNHVGLDQLPIDTRGKRS